MTFLLSEGTLEGIIETQEDSPRGFCWSTDEAAEVMGLLGTSGDGGSKRSVDAARLRKLMDSQAFDMHRARSNQSATRRVPKPWLGIDADVQPKLFRGIFNQEDSGSGLTARFLVHAPPVLHGFREYIDPPPEPSREVYEKIQTHVMALYEIPLELVDGVPAPKQLDLHADAVQLWAEEMQRMETLYPEVEEDEYGALGHARGRMLRLAAVLAFMRTTRPAEVLKEDMERAIVLMRYFLAQSRILFAQSTAVAETERLARLERRCRDLYESKADRGVGRRDLAQRVDRKRYSGSAGNRRAVSDLNAIGWTPQRPTYLGRGRRPEVGWFPPGSSPKSTKGTPSQEPSRSVDSVDDSRGANGFHSEDASALLEAASARLIEGDLVAWPTVGTRVKCPICGSGDGFGSMPDAPGRWHCFSDKHQAGGCAVDLFMFEQSGSLPSPAEAVAEAKRILGKDR